MATETFDSPSSSAYTWTAPSDQTITIELTGGGGGGSQYNGGDGGVTAVEVSVSANETLDVYVGGGGGDVNSGAGGVSYYNGGDGGYTSIYDEYGGGGGAASLVYDGSGSLIVVGDGGGGGAGGISSDDMGGGGGSRGGAGGTDGTDFNGGDGDGNGYGGDGGDADEDGSAGGTEVLLGTEVSPSISAASGGSQDSPGADGKVVIEYTPKQTPYAPSNLTTSVSADDISLSWDNVSDEDGYYAYRAKSSGSSTSDYTQIADLAADTTSYDDTGLLDGEKYYYRVSAYNSNGESDLSNEASGVTALPAPSNLTLNT